MSGETHWPEVSCRVVRGPDWKWNDQDGGEGGVGTVACFKDNGEWAIVAWDAGKQADYRASSGNYDLYVLDNAQTGAMHEKVTCDGCGEEPIIGMRWKCKDCYDKIPTGYDLCSTCYHGNKHDLDHAFYRVCDKDSTPILLKPRLKYFRKTAKGIFPGAVVVRGRDWNYANQDGEEGKSGIVRKFCDWSDKGHRDGVIVRWADGSSNCYRVGAEHCVDLVSPKPEVGLLYYKEQLPKLGAARNGEDTGDSGGASDRLAELFARLLVDRHARGNNSNS